MNRDAPPPQTITADAKIINEPSLISFDINKDDLVPFLKVLGDAEEMTISFPQGNEPQWTVKMDGSRNAAGSFEQCIAALGNTAHSSIAPTQPALPPAPRPVVLTDADIAVIIVRDSRANYHATSGPRACPDDRARNRSACGGRSAYSRPGGASPLCYRSDVRPWMIERYRQQRQASR